jgi:anti-sigma28 factor (negative regulator of flagellin synthesis)
MNQNGPQRVSRPDRPLIPKTQGLAKIQLNQKALEVIAQTPEVRCENVQVIKEFIAKGAYHGNSRQAAANLIADHFLMPGLVACRPGTGLPTPEAKISPSGGGGRNPETTLFRK